MLQKIDPSTTNAWKKLYQHKEEFNSLKLRSLFFNEPLRFKKLSLTMDDILFDFSKNLITTTTLNLLNDLMKECKVQEAIESMFAGERINETENRAVLHTALRNFTGEVVLTDGKDVMPDIKKVQSKMKAFSARLISGEWKGYTGQPITDVVNIGIGGSDLGPLMVYEALRPYHIPHINCHFVSNVDGAHLAETTKKLKPETTLFIIASKSFTTQETMANARAAKNWFVQTASEEDIPAHFVAVSTNVNKVKAFGIDPGNMFVFWDWVGGRYSLWSAIGLSLCCGLGYNNFEKLLKGAHRMDEHFRKSEFSENIPMLMAAIGIWNTNFLGAETEAIIPYYQNLSHFASYFQQANMESNGKYISREGIEVNYHTGPVIWGEPGTNGQHAFFQLIHQGTRFIPCDFIGFCNSHYEQSQHHILMANFFAQTEALMKGKSADEIIAETGLNKEDKLYKKQAVYRIFKGNKPTTTILASLPDPETIGKLIACYEHKIFVQGVIWNIFSFDQWGVELGKKLAGDILPILKDNKQAPQHDSSTRGLINYYLKNQLNTK